MAKKQRKESRQAYEKKELVSALMDFFPFKTRRSTVPEIHIRTTPPLPRIL